MLEKGTLMQYKYNTIKYTKSSVLQPQGAIVALNVMFYHINVNFIKVTE